MCVFTAVGLDATSAEENVAHAYQAFDCQYQQEPFYSHCYGEAPTDDKPDHVQEFLQFEYDFLIGKPKEALIALAPYAAYFLVGLAFAYVCFEHNPRCRGILGWAIQEATRRFYRVSESLDRLSRFITPQLYENEADEDEPFAFEDEEEVGLSPPPLLLELPKQAVVGAADYLMEVGKNVLCSLCTAEILKGQYYTCDCCSKIWDELCLRKLIIAALQGVNHNAGYGNFWTFRPPSCPFCRALLPVSVFIEQGGRETIVHELLALSELVATTAGPKFLIPIADVNAASGQVKNWQHSRWVEKLIAEMDGIPADPSEGPGVVGSLFEP